MLTNPVQDFINKTNLLNNILSNSRAAELSQKARSGAPAGSAPTSASAPDPTAFTPSGSPLLPRQLATKAGPQSEAYFESLVALYEQTARSDHSPPDDLAYAMEYFFVNSYMTYHDLHNVDYSKDPRAKRGKDMFERITLMGEKKSLQVTPYQEQAVYRQFEATLSANPAVRQMTDRQKQEVAELLAISLGMNLRAYMDAVNREDDRGMAAAHQQAKLNLERLTGVPADRIKITASGVQM